jgi:hypothetical protein
MSETKNQKPFRRHLFRRKVYATLCPFIPKSGLNTVHILQRREIFTHDVHDDNEKCIDDSKNQRLFKYYCTKTEFKVKMNHEGVKKTGLQVYFWNCEILVKRRPSKN